MSKFSDESQQSRFSPILDMTSFFNKEELAQMAETLIHLESFRKQVGLDEETVGGPIDVAVAEQPGRVLEATENHLLVENADGTKQNIPLARWLPGNRKTAVNQLPTVTVGQQIQPGDILVRSNMTDDKGAIALGLNANVIMVPWKGLNFEDGILVSESFAKRATSQHMYQHKIDWTEDYKMGKHSFMGIFPSTFNRRQLDQLDENGVIKPGTSVKYGDPLVLAVADGFLIISFDPVKNRRVYRPVLSYTVERNVPCHKVFLDNSRSLAVEVSSNESLAVYDWEKGCFEKVAPVDAVGKEAIVLYVDGSFKTSIYTAVEESGSKDVYDFSVEGTKVFAVNDGLIIYDTMNFHVPKSKDAVKEAYELLLPSKSLVQASDMKSAMPRMISESAGGLYLACLPSDKNQKPRTFMTWKDVEHAYQRGELAMDDPVVVMGK